MLLNGGLGCGVERGVSEIMLLKEEVDDEIEEMDVLR